MCGEGGWIEGGIGEGKERDGRVEWLFWVMKVGRGKKRKEGKGRRE